MEKLICAVRFDSAWQEVLVDNPDLRNKRFGLGPDVEPFTDLRCPCLRHVTVKLTGAGARNTRNVTAVSGECRTVRINLNSNTQDTLANTSSQLM